MPNTREKLIELLSDVQYLGGLEEKVADHLIANGVTFKDSELRFFVKPHKFSEDELMDLINAQAVILSRDDAEIIPIMPDRWIPVTERLPEENTRVLVRLAAGTCEYTRMDTDRLLNNKWVRWRGYVTHWMPLPEPPKGE